MTGSNVPFKYAHVAAALSDHAARTPDQVYVIAESADGGQTTFTYRDLANRAAALRNGLQELGVRPGDKVALFLPNCPEFLVAFFAVAALGAITVPLNVRLKDSELQYCLEHSAAIALVTDPARLDLARRLVARGAHAQHIILCRSAQPVEDTLSLEHMIAAHPGDAAALADSPATLDDPALILYTSGTTARPKGVMWSHGNCFFIADIFCRHYQVVPEDRHMVILPIYHVNGMGFSVLPATYIGGSFVLVEKFSASAYLEQVRRHGVTVASLLAMPIRVLLAQPPREDDRQHRIRVGFYALPLHQQDFDQFQDRFSIPLVQFYGFTEGPGQKLANPLSGSRSPLSIGRPLPGNEVRLVDEEGAPVPTGTVGEIAVRSSSPYGLMKGYYQDPAATAAALRSGWYHTGDLAYQDKDGLFYFVVRKKHMIKRAGENIAPAEVEAVLESHGDVAEVCVVGVPDPFRDEAVKAFVVLKPGAKRDPVALQDHCKQQLADYKIPEFIEFRSELPRDHVGRVKIRALLEGENGQGA